MTIQILYLPAFFSAEEEMAGFRELLKSESVEVSLNDVVVKPVSDIEESLIFELALLYADKTQDAFGPIKVSSTGIRYRVLNL